MSAGSTLRPALVWTYAALLQVAAVALAFLLAPFLGGARTFWLLAPGYIRHVGRCFGLRPGLEGWEELPEAVRQGRQPVIFIANHASLFDPPLLICTLPSRPVFVVKRELAAVPILGWVIWLAGFIFIRRNKGRQALASLRRAAARIRQGQSIVAFPEGTRTRTGELLPFKRGSFLLAQEAGVPLVPLGILGGRQVLPRGDWRVRAVPYRIRVGSPILPTDHPSAEALRQTVERAVAELLEDPAR